LSQKERLEALQRFRDGAADILLCTDIAARGIDVKGVHAVINYDMPKDVTTYVHRVGRTARAGRNGRAVTLTSENRRLIMKEIARHCHGFVKSRSVPDLVIAQWRARIDAMEDDIAIVMKEETLEKRMREAERDAARAANLIQHESEIKSRPVRTGFQNEKEKKEVATAAADDREQKWKQWDATEKDKTRKCPLNHKKRRLMDIRAREQALLNDRDHEKGTFLYCPDPDRSGIVSGSIRYRIRIRDDGWTLESWSMIDDRMLSFERDGHVRCQMRR
jgi:ATP-dependent RNA helicase DDX27